MEKEHVVLVDRDDNELGTMEKMEAHEKGMLHRAFSVFVYNSKGELLLQQRALDKYHSGGLWTNTCCSHPRSGEPVEIAAKRRLKEEMGMTCELTEATRFIYKKTLDRGLTEHELDYVFVGLTDKEPIINPEEVETWKYESLEKIKKAIEEFPENYTEWFKICLAELSQEIVPQIPQQ